MFLLAAVAAVLVLSPPVLSHHSIAGAYDARKPVNIRGTVREYHFVNPHPWIEMDAADVSGRMRSWRLELDNRGELSAIGMDADTLKPGDRITVFGIAAVTVPYGLYVRRLERADGLRYEQRGAVPVFTPAPR